VAHAASGAAFDALVIGGGAAGLMCALTAGQRGRRVLVVEHANRVGKKILMSGGGRCNFTNTGTTPANFLSTNPHFCKSALARYTPFDFIAMVERHGIAYHEKELGQQFCDESSKQIVAMLLDECAQAGVRIETSCSVERVQHGAGGYHLHTTRGAFNAPALVVATGGLSIPKVGATALGYDLARQFGIRVLPCRPALVPLTSCPEDRTRYGDLAGVAAEVVASTRRQNFREKLLVTHRGWSGPAILQISSYWNKPDPISIDLAPDRDVTRALRASAAGRDLASARAALREILPNRLAGRWLDLHAPDRWTNDAIARLEHQIHDWEIVPGGTEGYQKAEVTAGGVDTAELWPKTLESRKVPGLYFIGEVVDVTGHLGGFNFQWAWASGFCAGQAL
jgi:predicted Rossmann fold flavoprotein